MKLLGILKENNKRFIKVEGHEHKYDIGSPEDVSCKDNNLKIRYLRENICGSDRHQLCCFEQLIMGKEREFKKENNWEYFSMKIPDEYKVEIDLVFNLNGPLMAIFI